MKTLLIGLLSVGLVSTWVYHLYDKTQYAKRRTEVYVQDSTAVARMVKDSLQKIFSKEINALDARLDSTSTTAGMLQSELQTRLSEIKKLRSEINTILSKTNIRKEDLETARNKAAELQRLVAELQSRNATVEEEKNRSGPCSIK